MMARIEELKPDVIGKQLGQDVYGSKGNLLMRQGLQIQSQHYSLFKEIGYQSVYVQDNQRETPERNGHLGNLELRAKAAFLLRSAVAKLGSTNRNEVTQGKKDTSNLAEMLVGTNFNEYKGRPILDLKREADYVYQHSVNVALYSLLVGYSLKYHRLKLIDLITSALLHDIGMININKTVVNRPAVLEDEDYRLIREHTTKGFQFLQRNCKMGGIVSIVALQHHEHYDGSGYPNGRSGQEIHEFARIVGLTSFFDAYTSDRPYRRMHTVQYTVDKIRERTGTVFDPVVAENFLACLE